MLFELGRELTDSRTRTKLLTSWTDRDVTLTQQQQQQQQHNQCIRGVYTAGGCCNWTEQEEMMFVFW